MNTGPLTNAFNEDNEGVVLKEFIVYRVIDGNLTREKFVRQYHGNGDYTDHSESTPLSSIGFTLEGKIPGATGK
tara:strand:+ start:347 stop:568 length:222 start_codon:yes stop_codon:yes gene_type:complete